MRKISKTLLILLVIAVVAMPIIVDAFIGGAIIGAAIGGIAGGSSGAAAAGAVVGGLIAGSGGSGSGSGNGGTPPPPPQPEIVETWYEDNTGCGDEYPDILLGWEYEEEDGNDQEEYQIRVEDEDGNEYSAEEEGTADRYYFDEHFEFGLDHEWEVRVKSDIGEWSEWTSGVEFTTPYRYPEPDFSYDPEDPYVDELVTFTDESEVYVGDSEDTHRRWDFGNDVTPQEIIEGYGEEYEEVEVEFQTTESREIVLELTDSEGRTCSIEKILEGMEEEIPEWEETG